MAFTWLPPTGVKTVGPTAWRVGELAGTASGPVDVRLPLSPAKSFCAVGFQPPWLVCHVEVVAPPLLRGAPPRFVVALDTSASTPEAPGRALVAVLAGLLPPDTVLIAGDAAPALHAGPGGLPGCAPRRGDGPGRAAGGRGRGCPGATIVLISDGRATLGDRSAADLAARVDRPVVTVAVGEAAAQAQLAELAWRTGASGCGCGTPTTPRPSGRPWWSGRPSRPGRWRPPSRRRAPSRPTAWAGCRSTGSSMCRGRWSCVRWPGTRGEPLAPIKLVEGPADEGLLARWAVAEPHPPHPALVPGDAGDGGGPGGPGGALDVAAGLDAGGTPALPGALVAPPPTFVGPLPDATNAAAVAPHDAQAAATILRMDPDGPGYRRATEVLEAEPTDGRAALRLAEALAGSEAKDDAAGRLCTLARDALADGTGEAWAALAERPACVQAAMAEYPGNPAFFLMILGDAVGPVRVQDGPAGEPAGAVALPVGRCGGSCGWRRRDGGGPGGTRVLGRRGPAATAGVGHRRAHRGRPHRAVDGSARARVARARQPEPPRR
ncbi:MAG: hypothetical protein R3F60_23070 [bacterium]